MNSHKIDVLPRILEQYLVPVWISLVLTTDRKKFDTRIRDSHLLREIAEPARISIWVDRDGFRNRRSIIYIELVSDLPIMHSLFISVHVAHPVGSFVCGSGTGIDRDQTFGAHIAGELKEFVGSEVYLRSVLAAGLMSHFRPFIKTTNSVSPVIEIRVNASRISDERRMQFAREAQQDRVHLPLLRRPQTVRVPDPFNVRSVESGRDLTNHRSSVNLHRGLHLGCQRFGPGSCAGTADRSDRDVIKPGGPRFS